MYSREEDERCVYLGAGAMERMDDVAEEWRGATKNVCCCCEAAAVFVFVLYRYVSYMCRIVCVFSVSNTVSYVDQVGDGDAIFVR